MLIGTGPAPRVVSTVRCYTFSCKGSREQATVIRRKIVDELAHWIEAARAGSTEDFSRIVRAYHSRIRAYLMAYVWDRDLVEDLAQETFLTAYRNLGTFKGESALGVWLIGIARNMAARYLREKARQGAHESEFAETALVRWMSERIDGDGPSLAERERQLSALQTCVDRLPEHSASLVHACYFEGQSAASVARKMGKKEGTVWVMLLRIRQALRRCIENGLGAAGVQP